MFKKKESSSNALDLVGDKSKEMEIIPIFQPNSRVDDDIGGCQPVDVTSHGSPHDSSSNIGDVHDSRESSVQGGVEDETVQDEAGSCLGMQLPMGEPSFYKAAHEVW